MNFLTNIRDALRYLTDPKVPWRRKIWIYLALLYFLSPLDLLPDLIPGLGWLDDLIVLIAGISWFSREVKRYRNRPSDQPTGDGRTIDVEYEVCSDETPDKR